MRPPIWRRLELRGDLTLDVVHRIIQVAMGWEDYHLHRFMTAHGRDRWDAPIFTTDADDEYGSDSDGVPEHTVRLDQLLRAPKDRLWYVYDFGDDWEHTLAVESVRVATADDPDATCITGRGACPPEDCGGTWGYASILAAFKEDPSGGSLDDDLAEWLPEGFDPTRFDKDRVNARLALIGAGMGQIAAALDADPDDDELAELVHPGIRGLLARLRPDDLAEFERLTEPAAVDLAADPDDPFPEVSDEEITAALRPFQLMLDLAEGEGIPLTAAGWMRPAIVESIVAELDADRRWIGAGNRENQTWPVAELRELCQRLDLLTEQRGRLVWTPLGRLCARNSGMLWGALIMGIAPDGEGAVSDTTTLYLLHVGRGESTGGTTWGKVAAWLARAGWTHGDGTAIDGGTAREGAGSAAVDAAGVLSWVGGGRGVALGDRPATTVQRALALGALEG